MKYPECKKMRSVKEQSQTIGEFLDYLSGESIVLAHYERSSDKLVPIYQSIENLLADYFDIDLDKVEEEKRQMLDEMRKQMPRKRKKKIPWKYCECGCHCLSATLNGKTYNFLIEWERDERNNPNFEEIKYYLSTESHISNFKRYNTREELEDFVRKDALKQINFK
mgnify:CR=1 FL=1